MGSAAPFHVVPPAPFAAEELELFRAKLATFPSYHEPMDDLFVVFASFEEQKETVALYSRKTTPTFEVECFVQLRPQRLLVHPGGDPGAVERLREFVGWVLTRGPHRLVRAGAEYTLERLLPAVSDLQL